jgi:hypothetical protein
LKLAGILHLTGATNITTALATPHPTTSPTAADPLTHRSTTLAGGPPAGTEAEICRSESI